MHTYTINFLLFFFCGRLIKEVVFIVCQWLVKLILRLVNSLGGVIKIKRTKKRNTKKQKKKKYQNLWLSGEVGTLGCANTEIRGMKNVSVSFFFFFFFGLLIWIWHAIFRIKSKVFCCIIFKIWCPKNLKSYAWKYFIFLIWKLRVFYFYFL